MESLWCGGMQGTHRFNEREEVVEGFFFFLMRDVAVYGGVAQHLIYCLAIKISYE